MRLCNLPQVTHSDGAGGHQQSIIQSAVIIRQDKINGLKRIRKKTFFFVFDICTELRETGTNSPPCSHFSRSLTSPLKPNSDARQTSCDKFTFPLMMNCVSHPRGRRQSPASCSTSGHSQPPSQPWLLNDYPNGR